LASQLSWQAARGGSTSAPGAESPRTRAGAAGAASAAAPRGAAPAGGAPQRGRYMQAPPLQPPLGGFAVDADGDDDDDGDGEADEEEAYEEDEAGFSGRRLSGAGLAERLGGGSGALAGVEGDGGDYDDGPTRLPADRLRPRAASDGARRAAPGNWDDRDGGGGGGWGAAAAGGWRDWAFEEPLGAAAAPAAGGLQSRALRGGQRDLLGASFFLSLRCPLRTSFWVLAANGAPPAILRHPPQPFPHPTKRRRDHG
jgi:hypothetical protein